MPTFSIITVSYNEASNIQRTLDSIVGQTCHDYELIVVDGGSTDGTVELIRTYEHAITWWCSEPDRGIYNAMNKGVSHAIGDYLIFMNSGDAFYNNQVLTEVLSKGIHADVIEGYVMRTEKKRRLRERYEDRYVQLFTDTLSHQGAFIKRELLVDHPYDERYKIVADWKLWLETIILEGRSYEFIDTTIAYVDMTGISSVNVEQRLAEREAVIREMFPPSIVGLIQSYQKAYGLTLVRYAVELSEHHTFAYNLVRKIAKRVTKLARKITSSANPPMQS